MSATIYQDERLLRAQYERARTGENVIYARGPVLDPRNPVVALVREWREEGRVVTAQKRVQGDLVYLFQRCAAPASGKPGVRTRIDPEMSERPDGRLLAHLSRLANLGLPCPSNAELAEGAGLRGAEAVKYAFRLLKEHGHVRLVASEGQARVVEVIATGERTALPQPLRPGLRARIEADVQAEVGQ